MNNTAFALSVVSGEGEMFAGLVSRLSVDTASGPVGIYFGHAPLLATLRPGSIEIERLDGRCELLAVSGGFIEVQPKEGTTILADSCERAEDLDRERVLETQRRALDCIARCSERLKLHDAYLQLEIALARLRVLDANRRDA